MLTKGKPRNRPSFLYVLDSRRLSRGSVRQSPTNAIHDAPIPIKGKAQTSVNSRARMCGVQVLSRYLYRQRSIYGESAVHIQTVLQLILHTFISSVYTARYKYCIQTAFIYLQHIQKRYLDQFGWASIDFRFNIRKGRVERQFCMSSGREVESDNTVTSSRIFFLSNIYPFSRGFLSPHRQSPSLHCSAAFQLLPLTYQGS